MMQIVFTIPTVHIECMGNSEITLRMSYPRRFMLDPLVVGPRLFAIRPKKEIMSGKFLIYAMQSVRGDGYGISICLQEGDIRILDTFRRHLKTEQKLSCVIRDNPEWSNLYALNLSSRRMCSDLIALGRTNDKRKLHFPSQIPQDLKKHYVRGYYNADGCKRMMISSHLKRNESPMIWSCPNLPAVLCRNRSKRCRAKAR